MENTEQKHELNYPTKAEKNIRKEKLKSFKKVVLKIEIIVLLITCFLSASELVIGMSIYSSYSTISTSYYYETIMLYIRDLDYTFQMNSMREDSCSSLNMTQFNFLQVWYVKGTCFEPVNNTNSYELSYSDSTCKITTEFDFGNTQTINYWSNFYYCKKSYSQKDIKFHFTNNTQTCTKVINGTDCGTYSNYTLCMQIDQTVQTKNNITSCPIFSFRLLNNSNIAYLNRGDIENIKLNKQTYELIRKVSDEIPIFSFALRLSYGNEDSSYDKVDLAKEYINNFRDKFIDMSYTNNSIKYTVTTDRIDSDTSKIFQTILFNPLMLNQTIKLHYSNVQINHSIGQFFSLRNKMIIFPRRECMDSFQYDQFNASDDYITKFNLFINHIEISALKFIGFTIMELVFQFLFSSYYRGFLIYKEMIDKINPLDEANEEVTGLSKAMATVLLITLKAFTNSIQYFNIQDNLNFALKMNDNYCFINDQYLSNSLLLYYDNVETQIKTPTLLTLYIMSAHFFFFLCYFLLENYYYYKKKGYEEFSKLYTKGLEVKIENTQKIRASQRLKQN